MILSTMVQHAREKGFELLTVSDFTHPVWFKEISSLITETGEGVYSLRDGAEDEKNITFLFSTEISSIYKQNNKLRRIHNLVFMPDIGKAERFTKALIAKGANLNADGRPIVGLSSKDVLAMALAVSEDAMLIPCHVWTPHFGLFGSASGFDSIEEAFEDLSSYVYGVETGLSSDPEMNWQIPELENRSILSFSDAHSPAKMGREATVLELEELTYPNVLAAINRQSGRQKNNHVVHTVEFYPEEGKYHYSGHRACKVSLSPDEVRTNGDRCPVCRRSLTEGVFLRLKQLSGKERISPAVKEENEVGLTWYTDPRKHHPPYVKLVPLLEIVSEVEGTGTGSKKVQNAYKALLKSHGTEFDILMRISLDSIKSVSGERIAQAIEKVRCGDIVIKPGFDGEFGTVRIWREDEIRPSVSVVPQLALNF